MRSPTDGRTHHEDCWRDHHDCAIERLEGFSAMLREARDRASDAEEKLHELRDALRRLLT